MPSHEITWFWPFVFDPARNTLARDEDVAPLSPGVATLLSLLIDRAGDVVTRDEVQEALGSSNAAGADSGVEDHVRDLHAALGDGAGSAYIETDAKGYRFIAPVSTGRQSVGDHTPRPAPAVTPTDGSAGERWLTRGFVVLLVALAAYAVMRAR